MSPVPLPRRGGEGAGKGTATGRHATLHRPPARPARGRHPRHLVLAFVILHVLGDPVLLLLPQNAGKEEFERYRHLLGLDRPLYVQYWKFLLGRGGRRLRQVVVRRHAGVQARDRAHAADDLPDLRRPRSSRS